MFTTGGINVSKRNNPANEISDQAKKDGVKYWDILRGKGLVTRVGNRAWAKHQRYLRYCKARRGQVG